MLLEHKPMVAAPTRVNFSLKFENDGRFPNDIATVQTEMREWFGDKDLQLFTLTYLCDFCLGTFPQEMLLNYTCIECARYWDICPQCSAQDAQADGCPKWMISQSMPNTLTKPFVTGHPSAAVIERTRQLLEKSKHDVELYQRILKVVDVANVPEACKDVLDVDLSQED